MAPRSRPSAVITFASRIVTLILAICPRGGAQASPIDDPHVGGIGWGGPTTGDLTAVYWNPGALGMLRGNQVAIAASTRWVSTTVGRTAIDPMTGQAQPGASRTFPSASGTGTYQPLGWPPGPGGFLGVGADLGGRFTIALATYTPFAQRSTFAPTFDGQIPTRYHLISSDLRHQALVPALALRIGSSLHIGVAPGFMFSRGRLSFDEDTALSGNPTCDGAPCGAENASAAARYDLNSGFGLLNASPAFTVSGGIHYRTGPFDIGFSYASRPLGTDGGGIAIEARRSRVDRPARDLGTKGPLCPANAADDCVFGHIQYALPDILTAGVTWHALPRLDLTAIVRYLTFSQHDEISLRLVGPAENGLRAAGLPEQITLYRGFNDVVETRLRANVSLGSWVRLAGTLRAETAALHAKQLNAGAVDGFKLEPAIAVRVRIGSYVLLGAGYAFTFMFPVDTGLSVFDPQASASCDAAAGSLDSPGCQKRRAGAARPTAAGTYRLHTHAFSLALTAHF